MGADTGIKVTSTTIIGGVSNSVVVKMDVFTRDGQTNLVCDTRTKDGDLIGRIQSFYHDGLKVGESIETPDVHDYVAEASSPYSLSFRARSLHDAGLVYIRSTDWSYVDMFLCTNGVYYPAERSMIADFNRAEKQAMKQARSSNK
jgi:hypothetical protein